MKTVRISRGVALLMILTNVGATSKAGHDPVIAADVTQFGAFGNGKTNDTEAFRKAFASGAKDIHIRSGTYVLGPEMLIVPPQVYIHGSGSGTIIKLAKDTGTVFSLGRGGRFSGLTFDGSDSKSGGVTDGILDLGRDAQGVTLDKLTFTKCDRACICTDHAHDLIVRDCVFEKVGLAVSLQFSQRARIVDNRVCDARIHGLQFWGNWKFETKDSVDLIFSGNYVKSSGGGAIWGSGATRVLVTGNIVDGAEDVGIDLEWCDDAVITGNIVRNCHNAAISLFFSCRRVSITGNTLINDHPIENLKEEWWVRSGIWLTPPNKKVYKQDSGHSEITIVGNTIFCADGKRRAMWIADSDNVTIANNTMNSGGVWYGSEPTALKELKENTTLRKADLIRMESQK